MYGKSTIQVLYCLRIKHRKRWDRTFYHRIIPDAESYIKEQARTVLATLYNSPEDSIPAVHKIHYTLEDINGISAKGGGNGDVTIFYSTRHIEKIFCSE